MQKALLASYPRSGNALTRVILWQCFGVSVITRGKQSTGSNPLSRFFGRAYDGAPTFSNDDFVAQTVPGGELLIGKTHGLPGSNIPAIVVVRDGRAVVRSYARFRSEVIGVDTSIKDIICLPKRSWSAHVHAWLDHEGPMSAFTSKRTINQYNTPTAGIDRIPLACKISQVLLF
jgi:hypothetical protein